MNKLKFQINLNNNLRNVDYVPDNFRNFLGEISDYEGTAVIKKSVRVELLSFLILRKKLFEQTSSVWLTVLMNNTDLHDVREVSLAEKVES